MAIGKVVFTSRDTSLLSKRGTRHDGHHAALPVRGRKQSDYFDDIKEEKVPKDMLDLALHIVGTKRADFEPEKSEDQYEDPLKKLLRIKQKRREDRAPKEARSIECRQPDRWLRESIKARAETSGGSSGAQNIAPQLRERVAQQHDTKRRGDRYGPPLRPYRRNFKLRHYPVQGLLRASAVALTYRGLRRHWTEP